ncbi:nucleotide disphospho-sugar-binding domain-containing protein [Streptomyces rimosus]|uniref:nucleotide disphospho-sugar-binding domain-containing protein n=1 Tax=Streptomyces rimosus TaxID=1927 RepID=UPI0004C9711E|nr:nucleotide disphospho-sugar-binding domain-containing protein [Streptomyces rimosus]
MRILFTTYAARPHLYPLVPTAWSAIAAGHEVRVASTPSLADAVERTGIPSVTVGRDIDADSWYSRNAFVPRRAYDGEPEDAAWVRVTDQLALKQAAVAEAMADGLVDYGRSWRPDLVVHDPVTFAGPVAAQVLGVPSVCHLYGMARHLRLEIADRTGTEPNPAFLSLFDRFGVAPRVDPTLWIDPCPPSLRWPGQREISRRQIRYVPYNGPGAEPEWLRTPGRRPRVCVTWGTSQQKKMGVGVIELFGRIVRAVAELDVEVLVTVGATEREHLRHLGDLPDNVRPVGWVPLSVLADGCAAIVHTGGTGVMLTAAARGVPQLGITKIPEGRFNVERLAAVGAGLQVDQDRADAATVKDAVARLLDDPRHAAAAAELRADIEAQPLPADAVPALEELAAAVAR